MLSQVSATTENPKPHICTDLYFGTWRCIKNV